MGFCAYCGAAAVMTKEHIWAASLIRKYESLLTYSKKTHRFYKGEATIRDVCAQCNNVVLSALDEYLADLFDKFFRRFLNPGEQAALEYDYDMLLRALLKVSYNSSRSSGNDIASKYLKKYVKYIMEGSYRGDVMLRLQVVTSSRLVDLEGTDYGVLNPELLRCGQVPYDGVLSERFIIRLVALNCFWFFIIIPKKNESKHKWKVLLDGLSSWRGMPHGVLVRPETKSVVIPPGKTTYFDPVLMDSMKDAAR